MCGIWAVFGSDEDIPVLCQAVNNIKHRGPDAFRFESINHFQKSWLGFYRLAILDDVRGMQPMRLFTHPHVWLIYTGEIYNYKKLANQHHFHMTTDCDAESLIHLYAKYGMEFPAHLDGTFAFCLLDTANRKVFIGRDTFGVRPIYRVYTQNGFLGVCSEAKGMFGLSHSLKDVEADLQQVHPGTIERYELDMQGLAIFQEKKQFHRIGDEPLYKPFVDVESLGKDAHQNIRILLESAVKKRLMAERRVGCLLSGGLDSSLVASLLMKNAKEENLLYPIQTFSVGMEGSPDLIAARKVAKHLGTEHHEVVFTPTEATDVLDELIKQLESYDLLTIRSAIGMYLLSKYIREKTDTIVILSGEGSDELTQGYIHFHKAPNSIEADLESHRLLKDLYMYDVLRGDRSTAAWGLEIRVPFLDHQFTRYYLSLPPEDRIPKDGVEKHLLRSAFDKMNLLPREILWRPKEGFSDGVSPVNRPLYKILQDFCNEMVTDDELEQSPALYLFNAPKTKEALYYRRVFEKYYPGKSYWVPYIWMPQWVNDVTDPSPRTLKHYKP